MRILIAPNSFKGTLTSTAAAKAMAAGVATSFPDAEIICCPMADGGEGTVEVITNACSGVLEQFQVLDAEGELIEVTFGLIPKTGQAPLAVIEVAEVVGLTRLSQPPLPVEWRTTFGIGQLLTHVTAMGVSEIMIGLGGSSTNDGGAGVLFALGARFLDSRGVSLLPLVGQSQPAQSIPEVLQSRVERLKQRICTTEKSVEVRRGTLPDVRKLDFSAIEALLNSSGPRLTILADVQNPLCGVAGSTAVFGSQKGVATDRIEAIDGLLNRLGELGDTWKGEPISRRPGSGAAGGLGYALQLIGGQIKSGAEVVCELSGFDAALPFADWVMTGEGRSDRQTMDGKAPAIIAAKAREANIPVTLVSGQIEPNAIVDLQRIFSGGSYSVSETGPAPSPEEASSNLRRVCETLRPV
jgi:glycerate 2-kinase